MIMRAVGAMVTAILAPAVAMAQTSPYEEVLPQERWTLDLGGGPVYGFSANGGGARKTRLTPWASLNYKDRVYANGLDGVGYNFVKADDLRIGVQLRPRYGSGKPEGLDLKRPDFGADAAVYAFKRLPWNVVVGARATRDVSNISDGAQLFASVGRQTLTPIGLLQTIGYARAGDKRAVRAYYGISTSEAAASGLPAYRPDGGLQNAGAAALLMAPIGDRYGVGAFVNYERLLSDSADSPIVRHRNVWRAGLIAVRRFSWN